MRVNIKHPNKGLPVSKDTPNSHEHSREGSRRRLSWAMTLTQAEKLCPVFWNILLSSFYFVTTETAKGFSWVVWVKMKWDQILRNCWTFPEKQRPWVIILKGLPCRGRWKRTVSQHGRQGLTIRHWLIGRSQDDLKGVNSMDGEKLFSVVHGDRRRSGGNESQNTDDLGGRAGHMP